MISERDGGIYFDSPDYRLSPRTTMDEFIASPLFRLATPFGDNPPWMTYGFKPVHAAGETFACSIAFNAGRPRRVNLGIMRPGMSVSWDNWTPEKQIALKLCHDEFLRSLLETKPKIIAAPLRNPALTRLQWHYAWGVIESSYEDSDSTSGIIVNYES